MFPNMLWQIPQRVTIFPSDSFSLNENFSKGYLGYASRETAPAPGSSHLSDQPPGGWMRRVSTITHREKGQATWVTNPQVGGWGGWAPSLTVKGVKPPEWPTPRWVDQEGEHHHSPWTGSSHLSDQPPGGWMRRVSTITHREHSQATRVTHPQVWGQGGWAPSLTVNSSFRVISTVFCQGGYVLATQMVPWVGGEGFWNTDAGTQNSKSHPATWRARYCEEGQKVLKSNSMVTPTWNVEDIFKSLYFCFSFCHAIFHEELDMHKLIKLSVKNTKHLLTKRSHDSNIKKTDVNRCEMYQWTERGWQWLGQLTQGRTLTTADRHDVSQGTQPDMTDLQGLSPNACSSHQGTGTQSRHLMHVVHTREQVPKAVT